MSCVSMGRRHVVCRDLTLLQWMPQHNVVMSCVASWWRHIACPNVTSACRVSWRDVATSWVSASCRVSPYCVVSLSRSRLSCWIWSVAITEAKGTREQEAFLLGLNSVRLPWKLKVSLTARYCCYWHWCRCNSCRCSGSRRHICGSWPPTPSCWRWIVSEQSRTIRQSSVIP